MRRRNVLKATAVTLLASPLLGFPKQEAVKGPIVSLRSGKVRGTVSGGVHRFLGIPYAEPPFGVNRFVPPVSRASWEGVFEADRYGLLCPQTGGGTLPPAFKEGEDCLNLNVWTPDPGSRGLPVMVWVHGGGQVTGTGSAPHTDGTDFAKEGVVMIANNRRLGAEGYLYLQEYFGDGIGPGNLGILDQIEVLKWVQENVEHFGGDPNNVTLFGISGGGAAIQAAIATHGSKGLVHRVIPQSGGHAAQRPEPASEIAKVALNELGIKPGDLDSLRRVPWPRFPQIYKVLQDTGLGNPQIYWPVINEAMPIHPVDASHQGLGSDLDYLTGTCRDEANTFVKNFTRFPFSVFEKRAADVIKAGNASQEAVENAYHQARPALTKREANNIMVGDMWFRAPTIRIADGHARMSQGRTFMYQFTWESTNLGAGHGVDSVMFGNARPPKGSNSPDLVSAKMRRAWVNFARSGNPSFDGFDWPEYELDRRLTVSINDEFTVLKDPFKPQRDVLGDVLTMNWQKKGL